MAKPILNGLKTLDEIVKKTLESLEESKLQIFDILETTRAEYERMKAEVEELKRLAGITIEQVDALEQEEKAARMRLLEASRDFQRYSDQQVRQLYADVTCIQAQLYALREQEQQLRKKRDEMELRLRNLEAVLNRAQKLVGNLGAAISCLISGLDEFSGQLEDIQRGYQMGIGIIKAQEEERKRVAREIHDGPAQSIANALMLAGVCEKIFTKEMGKACEELRALKECLSTTLSDLRRIVFNLRPMLLDDLGLIPTIRHMIDQYKETGIFHADLLVFGREQRLPAEMEVALYRIISEALQNCAKHARAKHVKVKLEFQLKQVVAQVEDDGCGFDLDELKTGNSEHLGLISMEERANLLHGKLQIHTVPGKGTKIRVSIPYMPQE